MGIQEVHGELVDAARQGSSSAVIVNVLLLQKRVRFYVLASYLDHKSAHRQVREAALLSFRSGDPLVRLCMSCVYTSRYNLKEQNCSNDDETTRAHAPSTA